MKPKHYFKISSEEELKNAALKGVPTLYKILKLTYSERKFKASHPQSVEWLEKQKKESRIWPFCFNQNTLAMRKGFLAVEKGIVLDYLITEQS